MNKILLYIRRSAFEPGQRGGGGSCVRVGGGSLIYEYQVRLACS